MTREEANVRSERGTSPLVLLIEDEASVRRTLEAGLEANGYRVEEATTGLEGLKMAAQYLPDVILLDLGLPDMDGVEVVRSLRVSTETPVVVLSARTRENEKVAALDAGADDYVTKPFGFSELLARLRTALRHAARKQNPEPGSIFETAHLRVDLETRRVFVHDREIHLTPIEYKLLIALVRNVGRVVTHQQLLAAVWGRRGIDHAHYLRIYVGHLRRKLEPDPGRPRILRTEIGVGYRLMEQED
ncbi:MAG: response regulator [Deltaproteobacteria bacterium]|nr:response regulator [Deltaproteobacteria bacterium]